MEFVVGEETKGFDFREVEPIHKRVN